MHVQTAYNNTKITDTSLHNTSAKRASVIVTQFAFFPVAKTQFRRWTIACWPRCRPIAAVDAVPQPDAYASSTSLVSTKDHAQIQTHCSTDLYNIIQMLCFLFTSYQVTKPPLKLPPNMAEWRKLRLMHLYRSVDVST